MGALVKTIGMLIACLALLACCWGSMLATVVRCGPMDSCLGLHGPVGWLFWLVPIAIWGVGSLFLFGFLREGLDGDERWALGMFWLPFLGGVMLLLGSLSALSGG